MLIYLQYFSSVESHCFSVLLVWKSRKRVLQQFVIVEESGELSGLSEQVSRTLSTMKIAFYFKSSSGNDEFNSNHGCFVSSLLFHDDRIGFRGR